MPETWVQFLGQEDPWRREWQPIPEFLPGEFNGQRGLAGYRLLGSRVTQDRVNDTFTFTYACLPQGGSIAALTCSLG